MNDFTREDLVNINIAVCSWVDRHPEDKGMYIVQLRVQSFIERHDKEKAESPPFSGPCQHESDKVGYMTDGVNGAWYEKCAVCGCFY